MNTSASVAVTFALIACGGEASQLGAVSTGGTFDGRGGEASGAGAGGTSFVTGGTPSTGGVLIVAGGPGSGAAGAGKVEDGGRIPLTSDMRNELLDQSCAGWLVEGEALPTAFNLVVDVSASMGEAAPVGARVSKWSLTQNMLLAAVDDTLGPGWSGTALGLLLYPNTASEARAAASPACSDTTQWVPAAQLGPPDGVQRSLLSEGLLNAVVAGATPTLDAYRFAWDWARNSALPGRQFMVLVTDGAPTVAANCEALNGEETPVDPAPIIDEILLAYAAGLSTFVVGTPGSESNQRWLSQAAVAGGTARPGCNVDAGTCHLELSAISGLRSELQEGAARVNGNVSSCTFDVMQPAGVSLDSDYINVILSSGGQDWLILRNDRPDCTYGWQVTSNDTISLCPQTCAALRSTDSVNVLFGCMSLTQ